MKTILAACVAVALAAIPAQAAVPVPVMKVMGADFYVRCTNPPTARGQQIVGICAAYVAGIADGLADAGQVCMGPGMTAPRLLPIALRWLNAHAQNGSNPAALQIKTGLTKIFPCRQLATTQQQQRPSIEQAIEFGTKFFSFLKAAQPVLSSLGL